MLNSKGIFSTSNKIGSESVIIFLGPTKLTASAFLLFTIRRTNSSILAFLLFRCLSYILSRLLIPTRQKPLDLICSQELSFAFIVVSHDRGLLSFADGFI